jgi:hypothetical protein
MRELQQEDVIRIMREEWGKKVSALQETVDLAFSSKVNKDGEKPILAPELKVMHRNSGIRYTVSSVGPRDIILRTPEGEDFLVDKETLEAEYELD